jgi:YVTN family beta-propeller protein
MRDGSQCTCLLFHPCVDGGISSVFSSASSAEGLLVVVNSGENTIALVNPAHPEAIKKITTRKHPQDIVISPDGSLAYVAEMGTTEAPGNAVAVIDLRSRQIVKRFSLGRATLPHLLALSREGQTLWAACAPENAIVELDTRDGVVRKIWDTQQTGSYLFVVTPDEKKLYVANFDAGTVSVIGRPYGAARTVVLGGQPIGIDISLDGAEVWVSNFQNSSIAIIDTATDSIMQTLPAGGDGPARVKFTPDGKEVWITQSRSNELVIFAAARRRIIRHIPTGRFSKGLLILPDGQHGFVSAMEDNEVVEVDVAAGRVLERMSTGKAPEGLAWINHSRMPSHKPLLASPSRISLINETGRLVLGRACTRARVPGT